MTPQETSELVASVIRQLELILQMVAGSENKSNRLSALITVKRSHKK
ncbi:hypothetical protein [Nostoc sp. MG11]|nr:hypothetical protein [Nostoc sp. MG11]